MSVLTLLKRSPLVDNVCIGWCDSEALAPSTHHLAFVLKPHPTNEVFLLRLCFFELLRHKGHSNNLAIAEGVLRLWAFLRDGWRHITPLWLDSAGLHAKLKRNMPAYSSKIGWFIQLFEHFFKSILPCLFSYSPGSCVMSEILHCINKTKVATRCPTAS